MRARYTLPDMLRGVAVISMVLYHTAWDLVYIFGVRWPWFGSAGADIWQASIAWTFILLSGFCWALGRHRLRRALLVLACAAAISAVTLILMPQNAIRFGILSLLGTGMLVTIPLDKVFRRVSPYVGLVVCGLLFVLTRHVSAGYLGCGEWTLALPQQWYANDLTAYLGLRYAGFFSTDYVPLLPWLFLYWVGCFAYLICVRWDMMRYLSSFACPPLEWIGRRALLIYMLHQPLIYGALTLVF